MLGFRSLFRIHDTPELLGVASQQLYQWLVHKRLDPSALVEGPEVEIGEDVWGSLQRLTDDIGSETIRARIVENQPGGSWTSELTAHSSPTGNRGWVWLDIHKPDDHGWTATPRLARTLVSVLPVRDGAHLLGSAPMVITEREVPQVVAALTDPTRRGLAFVAGSGHAMRVTPWRDAVDRLLNDTVGLANAWVLTPDATDHFNYLVGQSHEATPGFVRTFVPGVAVRDGLDGERHRFLTATSIERSPERALRRVLGQRAREQLIATKLPDALRDLDRILRRSLDAALLDGLVTDAPPAPPPAEPPPAAPDSTSDTTEPTPAQGMPRALELQLSELLHELVGSRALTVDSLGKLGEMALAQRRAEVARVQIRTRLDRLQDEVEAEQFERELAQHELTELQEEYATSEEERADTDRKLRHVRLALAKLDHADVAWTDPVIDLRDIRPDTFAELLERCGSLERVVFTGDVDVTQDLDRHGNRRLWAGKTWEALLVLEDYARIRIVEAFSRDVSGYLFDTPAGCRTFSANRHAALESDTVQQNPRYRAARQLRVPADVDPSEQTFMGAHFKIAQARSVSPRMHYLDDTAKTGQIYVGYIGPHLPTDAS